RLLGGIPLILHTVQAAQDASRIDAVVVSTNDTAVAKLAMQAGVEVIERPDRLATPETPTTAVITHAVEHLEAAGVRPDPVITLQPTSPLRTSAHIDATVALLDDAEIRSATTVTSLDIPITTVGWLKEDRLRLAVSNVSDPRRQVAPQALRITGGVYATRRALLAEGRLLDERPAVVMIDADSAIDIDTPADLRRARLAYRRRSSTAR
ncbi:MAG TPA: acylneuraminate cytidylyltransferase family protein, partial [Gemmatimonadales bacterium]|nr:acylneuraminate cytidylyltransferase family protein [Gemmatimonadales bacterium]